MQIDPVTAAVVGALVTVTGILYRHLLQEKAKCEAEVMFWRNRALRGIGLAAIATDEAVERGETDA